MRYMYIGEDSVLLGNTDGIEKISTSIELRSTRSSIIAKKARNCCC